MPRFLTSRDFNFINNVNKELINTVIDTPVLYYEISEIETKDNLYNESLKKIYKRPVKLSALITNDAPSLNMDDDAGSQESQIITIAFQREYLKSLNVYPQIGEIIKWNFGYYEIDHPVENQFLAGKVYFNHSIVYECHLTNMEVIKIEENNI